MTYRDLLRCELARREFWEYCKLIAPDFYRESRQFLKDKCQVYQDFYESDEEYLIDNEPPRHGKSRTATLFVQWVLGKYPTDKVITGSYNETLSTVFSKGVRNKIQETSADGRIVYSDIFPNTRVKRGDGAANLWGIEGNDTNSYLATSPTGTATGFGADLMLIDDLIKNEYEARNANIKEQHFKWFNDTMLSRREGKRKVIIVMTRWASDDLAGLVMQSLDRQGKKYRLISYKAFDGVKMLCDDILSREQYNDILNGDTGKDIIEANYNQTPIDLVGRLYTEFKEYEELPKRIESVESYTDTADEGADYLCSIIYAVSEGKAYVLDVIYTQEGMEITEKAVAKALTDFSVNRARIESNNGGRGFARNVKRIAQEEHGNNITKFIPFSQTKNKASRILTGSTGVMNNVLFPKGWENKWKDYWRDMVRYQRTGKNAHDDAQDATTGVYEYLPKRNEGQYHSILG
jgi:predicted phage terminase large subunit-like protein